MSDLSTAFQLLDIIQGHPGYEVKCYQCEEPMTDILGTVLPDVQWQQNGWEPGPKHYDSAFGETCPIRWTKDQERLRAEVQREKTRYEQQEENMVKLRVSMSHAKSSPPGPFFPAESPE